MLLDVRVVRRCLECDIERDFDAELIRLRDESVECLDTTELGVDSLVAAVFRPHRPRAPRVVGPGRRRVVLSLAKGRPNRMDGREVDDVEPELFDPREALGRVVESAVPADRKSTRLNSSHVAISYAV